MHIQGQGSSATLDHDWILGKNPAYNHDRDSDVQMNKAAVYD